MNSELKTQIENFKKVRYLELRGKLFARHGGKKICFPEPKFDLLKLSNRDLKKYFKDNGIKWKHHTHKNLYHNLIWHLLFLFFLEQKIFLLCFEDRY